MYNRTKLRRLLVGLSFALSSGALHAGGAADSIETSGAFARAVPPGLPNSAVFVDLVNHDAADHALVAAESDASRVVELHTHRLEDGMMRMRPVERIDLPAGETVRLAPGGLHIMLIGLERPIDVDTVVALELIFEDGSRRAMNAVARKVQPPAGREMRVH